MTSTDILQIRLSNQQLSHHSLKNPEDIVEWLGAVQSQDYPGAKWAISQRLENSGNNDIENAFNEGKFLRTHVMRPTWHFVSSKDIRWMLDLTGTRVKGVMRSYNRQLGLTEELFNKSNKIFGKTLSNNNYLNRAQLGDLLRSKGFKWEGNGLAHIVMWAELDGLICSGPVVKKKQTYALLEERVSKVKPKGKEEALIELVKRYFKSHGPAQIQDFAWWSGLTSKDARKGLESIKSEIKSEEIGGKTYYFYPSKAVKIPDKIFLVPNYDEYTIAYKDRTDLLENVDHTKLDTRQNALFNNAVIINGKAGGLWRRSFKTKEVAIEVRLFKKLNTIEAAEFKKALQRYADYLGLSHKIIVN